MLQKANTKKKEAQETLQPMQCMNLDPDLSFEKAKQRIFGKTGKI